MPVDVASMARSTVAAYAALDSMSFAYGQGSRFAGFSTDSDLDIVIVWDRDQPPAPPERPVRQLSDQEPVQFHEPAFALDKLVVNGQDIDVVHYTRATFDCWCSDVAAGDGWQTEVWPLPLHAAAGFRYGTMLADPFGAAARARERLTTSNTRLLTKATHLLQEELPAYRKELDACARRGDGWLFHELATRLVKHCYVAWFAAEGHHCPFPKHLDQWVARLDLSRERARLAQRIWAGTSLLDRLHAIGDFAENLVGPGAACPPVLRAP